MRERALDFHFARNPAYLGVEFRAFSRRGDAVWHAEPLVMSPVEPTSFAPPAAMLEESEAQTMLDRLWQAGFRPSESLAEPRRQEATDAHLADLRELALGERYRLLPVESLKDYVRQPPDHGPPERVPAIGFQAHPEDLDEGEFED